MKANYTAFKFGDAQFYSTGPTKNKALGKLNIILYFILRSTSPTAPQTYVKGTRN